MKNKVLLLWYLLLASTAKAGVYGELEFGDNRETVTKKLSQSPLVEKTIDDVFTSRCGLNGIFKCKAKIAGLVCHLYFNWDEQGGLNEITLRSEGLQIAHYQTQLRRAWTDSEALFSRVYQAPSQKAPYPPLGAFKQHKMMISRVWQNEDKATILMGTGVDKDRCFLFIRFVEESLELQPEP